MKGSRGLIAKVYVLWSDSVVRGKGPKKETLRMIDATLGSALVFVLLLVQGYFSLVYFFDIRFR